MKDNISTGSIRTVAVALISLALLLLWPAYAAAQSIDTQAVWVANKPTAVQVKVWGKDASGGVSVRTGSGVIVGSNGEIVTALHVVGKDSDWLDVPERGLDRRIEVIALGANGIEHSLGLASASPVPGQDIAVLHTAGSGLPEAAISEARAGDLAPVVVILWDPDSKQPKPVEGYLVPTEKGKHGSMLTVRMKVMPGHSGSGIFGADKKLIGIITNQLGDSEALAVPVQAFSWFLAVVANIQPAPRLKWNHIAILPFRNVDQDKSIDQLSVQIPIALNGELGRHYSLSLVPIRSCLKYKECTARDVGRDLNVGIVVDGSYQLFGERLHVTVDLIDSSQDYQFWSHSFDIARSDILNLIGQMIPRIEAVLQLRSDSASRGDMFGTPNADAYELYLRGIESGMVVTRDNNDSAIRFFRQAIGLDPRFARAHAALAEAYVTHFWWNFSNDSSWAQRAEKSAQEALKINSNLPEAHYALAYSLEAQGKRLEAAREYFKSTRLDPNYVPALASVARHFYYMADFDRALATLETIASIDPTANVHVRRAMCFYFAGNSSDSLWEARQAESRAGGVDDLTLIAFTYVWLKDIESAQRVLDRLKKEQPTATINIAEVQAWLYTARGQFSLALEQMEIVAKRQTFGIYDEMATLYAIQGNAEQSLSWLEKAVESGAPNYAMYRSDFFKVLRNNPRYEAILNELSKEYAAIRNDAPSR
jgi:tetratricopeptide (TPR) repeat protein/TolB-like protein